MIRESELGGDGEEETDDPFSRTALQVLQTVVSSIEMYSQMPW